MQFKYQSDYPGPALPVVEVTIRGNGGYKSDIALVDSGADASLIPISILDDIDSTAVDTRWARNISGGRYRVVIYLADLSIGDLEFPFIEVIANHQTNEIVLGRDVLNQAVTTLDGPAGMVLIFRE